MILKSTEKNISYKFNIIVLTIFDILLRQRDICSGSTRALYIVTSWAAFTNATDSFFICRVFFHGFCFLFFQRLFLSLCLLPSWIILTHYCRYFCYYNVSLVWMILAQGHLIPDSLKQK